MQALQADKQTCTVCPPCLKDFSTSSIAYGCIMRIVHYYTRYMLYIHNASDKIHKWIYASICIVPTIGLTVIFRSMTSVPTIGADDNIRICDVSTHYEGCWANGDIRIHSVISSWTGISVSDVSTHLPIENSYNKGSSLFCSFFHYQLLQLQYNFLISSYLLLYCDLHPSIPFYQWSASIHPFYQVMSPVAPFITPKILFLFF